MASKPTISPKPMPTRGYWRPGIESQIGSTVYFEETGEERRIESYCLRCNKMLFGNRYDAYGPVSANGVAHMGEDGGMTACGLDATGPRWWWPV